ncbi:MCE family protein [bacterium]|nr:MCE family protein [bacterium]
MATKRQKIEVGVFLSAAALILTGVLFYLSGMSREVLDTYYIEFEENVSGLGEGSRVTYMGVAVGKITDVVVTAGNRVRCTIGVNPKKVIIREGLTAKYSMETLFGPFVIDLSGGMDQSNPLLPANSTIEVRESIIPVIERGVPETLSQVNGLIAVLTRLLSTVDPKDVPLIIGQTKDILETTHDTITALNEQVARTSTTLNGAIESMRSEFEKLSGAAAATMTKLEGTGDETAKLIKTLHATVEENREALKTTLEQLNKTLASADAQIGKLDLVATEKNLREAAEKVSKAADAVGASADAVAGTAKTVGATGQEINRSMASVERSLLRALTELEQTLRSARRLIDGVERDPSSLIRGKDGGK